MLQRTWTEIGVNMLQNRLISVELGKSHYMYWCIHSLKCWFPSDLRVQSRMGASKALPYTLHSVFLSFGISQWQELDQELHKTDLVLVFVLKPFSVVITWVVTEFLNRLSYVHCMYVYWSVNRGSCCVYIISQWHHSFQSHFVGGQTCMWSLLHSCSVMFRG